MLRRPDGPARPGMDAKRRASSVPRRPQPSSRRRGRSSRGVDVAARTCGDRPRCRLRRASVGAPVRLHPGSRVRRSSHDPSREAGPARRRSPGARGRRRRVAGMNRATTSSPTNLSTTASCPTRTSWPCDRSDRAGAEGIGSIASARPVDPRTSAKSRLSSISAPPWARSSCLEAQPADARILAHGPRSIIRINGALGPANGAAHILQRGELGSRRKNRARGEPRIVPSSIARHAWIRRARCRGSRPATASRRDRPLPRRPWSPRCRRQAHRDAITRGPAPRASRSGSPWP